MLDKYPEISIPIRNYFYNQGEESQRKTNRLLYQENRRLQQVIEDNNRRSQKEIEQYRQILKDNEIYVVQIDKP